MSKLSVSVSPMPPFLSIKVDVPIDDLLKGSLHTRERFPEAPGIIRAVLKAVLEDQYTEGDALGAWSRRYPEHLRGVYGSEVPSDTSVRDSITVSAFTVIALVSIMKSARHSELTAAIRPRLDSYVGYLHRHFDEESGGFGLISRPTSRAGTRVVADLRHTAWAVISLAHLEAFGVGSDERLRSAAAFLRSHLERMKREDERVITYAALHCMLNTEPVGTVVVPAAQARRAILKRLESRIIEGFDPDYGTWDVPPDPADKSPIDNALYVLYCLPICHCVDAECQEVLRQSVTKLLSYRRDTGLPLTIGGVPDPGATATLAHVVARSHQSLAVPVGELARLMSASLSLMNPDTLGAPAYPWHIASLLLLASEAPPVASIQMKD